MRTRTLQLFADSADSAEVVPLLRDHLVHGVTTNPEILRSDGVRLDDLPGLVVAWVEAGAQEVYLQTWGQDTPTLLAHAGRLRGLSMAVGVKVPATEAGFAAAATLAADGIPVLVTAVYEAAQALTAAAIGARWIAPYLGRLDDAGRDGLAEIGTMAALLEGTGTGVLAASIRSPQRLVDLAEVGVTAFTARPAVLRAALSSPSSQAAAAAFEEAMTTVV